MSRVMQGVCIVFLSVYSVAGLKPVDYNLSHSATLPPVNVEVIPTPSESNSMNEPEEEYEESYDTGYLDREFTGHYRRFYPFFPSRRDDPPKHDPWPHRPHTLNNSLEKFPLAKCCSEYRYLHPKLRDCEYEKVHLSPRPWLTLPLNGTFERFPPCAAEDMLRLGSIEAFNLLSFSERGSLLLKVKDVQRGTRQVELERSAACADVVLGDNAPFGVLLCPCAHTACVRKCCGKAQALVAREASVATVTPECEELSVEQLGSWNPQVGPRPEALGAPDKKGYVVLPGTLPSKCEFGRTRAPPSWAQPKPGEDFHIVDGGLAYINTIPQKETYNFCVDGERLPNGSLAPSIVFCADAVPVPVVDRWMAALGVLGALALAAAVAVHALLPELRATPFGRALTAYAAALLALAVIGIAWTVAPDVSRARCIVNVIWSQYFMQAAAFWLNVMCYDIGIAFSSYRGTLDKTGKAARRRYIRYAQYAWGCPFITAIPVVALQFTHPPGNPWRPIEWFMKCHYSSSIVQLVFFYLPLLLLLILNCAIFVWTAYRIQMLQKGAEILTEDSSNEESPYPTRKRMLLFLKLLWLMGVGETLLELIAWSASASAHWYTSNVVDFSRALCVFGLSCCKGTVLRRLRERFRDRLCCAVLRRGSRVGPDPDAEAATAAAAATDSTDVFSFANSTSVAQAPSSGTAAQDATGNVKSIRATLAARDVISNTPTGNDGHANSNSPLNGIFKSPASREVVDKEAEKDNEPPPGGIQMKVLSTTSL